jgi:glycosyltransferase involved in cell wall biosynthesis
MFNDRVIAVSEATRRFHQRYNFVRPGRIDVVHNFIDEKRFHRATRDDGARLRAQLNLPEDALVLGCIGDVIPRKGLIHLIGALPRIIAAVPNTRLLCVGHEQRDYAARCRSAAEQLGVAPYITWTGSRSDIDIVMASLDVYVLPSLEENLPLSILEAMASGRPVVATAVGGIPECVVAERTGLLVPRGAEEALAEAVIRVLADPALRNSLGRSGRQRVSEGFSVDSQIARIERIFQRMAA